MYSCSCIDYALHSTVCKHIHLVQMQTICNSDFGNDVQDSDSEYKLRIQGDHGHGVDQNLSNSLSPTESSSTEIEAKSVSFNSSEYFTSVLDKEQQFKSIENTKVEMNSLMLQLKTQAENCISQEQLNVVIVVKSHLRSAVSSMEAYNHHHITQRFNQTSNPPPNACNKKQLHFFFLQSVKEAD